MKHPNEGTLALHAAGDLGLVEGWRTGRHLAKCDRCRDSVAAFAELRAVLPELAEIPEVPWNRLAAEMRANIRLGLAAGECVRTTTAGNQAGNEAWNEGAPVSEWPRFGVRAALAFASVVVLAGTGLMLERPAPVAAILGDQRAEGPLVQATENGIQVRTGGSAFRLMNAGAKSVTYSASADGSMGARYVDPETGYVTINNV
ncbi:MAG TPA: hypothetical protein VKJ01_28275, partial [Candidatus Solibacter sp.]|nr:hypothetical protein [Candidatus Solibacter sp.]